MDVLFVVAFFAVLAGVVAYSLATYYSTSKMAKGWILIVALLVTVPLIALGVYAILSGDYEASTRMWAMGVCALCGGFWLKNPTRDFVDG